MVNKMEKISVVLDLQKKTTHKAVYSDLTPGAPLTGQYVALSALPSPLPPKLKFTVELP